MKSKGRRYKRAVDALYKIHLGKFSSVHSSGYVVSTSKKHPNYFKAMLWNEWEKKWELVCCSYISTYMYNDGSWVKSR